MFNFPHFQGITGTDGSTGAKGNLVRLYFKSDLNFVCVAGIRKGKKSGFSLSRGEGSADLMSQPMTSDLICR